MTQRRLTRLEQKAPSDASTSRSTESEVSKEMDADDFEVEKVESKKRKAVDDKTAPRAKKFKGRRGILRNVVEMPLDVIFEIFGRLAPIDLWNLAQTTRDLRAMLMSRSSVSVWREARRASYPDLPNCPNDLTEPHYAVLVFGKHCFECLRIVKTIHTFWDARVRLCTTCVETICFKTQYGYDAPLQTRRLSEWIPMIENARKNSHSVRHYYQPLMISWDNQYQSLTTQLERNAWESKLIKERESIAHHARACSTWFNNLKASLNSQKLTLIQGRKEAVLEYVKKIGWADELLISPKSVDHFLRDSTIVTKVCQKNLTERALENLADYINEYMTATRYKRVNEAKKMLLMKRLPVLKKAHAELVRGHSPNFICPSPGQLFFMPMVYDIITNAATGDLTKTHLHPVVKAFPDLVSQWQEESKQKLLKMITTMYGPDHIIDEDSIFDLATTFFSCRFCPGRQLRYPDVLLHPCLRSVAYTMKADDPIDIDVQMCRFAFDEGTWNQLGRLYFNSKHVKSAGDIVELCGFDRRTTTLKEMNDADPILECLSCHCCLKGRATMAWSTASLHKYTTEAHITAHLPSFRPTLLKLLDETEAAIVRKEIAVKQEQKRAGHKMMTCATCYRVGGTVELKRHIRQDHARVPNADDMLPLITSNHASDIYRMWPPRDEEDHKMVTGTEIS